MSVRLRIIAAMKQIAEEQQVKLPPLNDELSLHETGFDSLAFAILVARLEDDLGIDPFTISEDAAFPLTVGDFVRAYEMSPREVFALRDYLGPELKGRTISDAGHIVSLTDILSKTCLAGRLNELSGRSVLLQVTGQLLSGLVMK